MRIVFICGSLEPGQDGVGDYTRRMSGELIKKGHEVSMISLYDKGVVAIACTYQPEQEQEIETIRIPKNTDIQIRLQIAKQHIDRINPQWLSLQFVPFSFNDKGLPFKLATDLKQIGSARNWHIMFHELWVGMNRGTSLKKTIWGNAQRYIVWRLLSTLKPKVVSTQSSLYMHNLSKIGATPVHLPLFSNIENYGSSNGKKPDKLVLLVFGSIHPGAPVNMVAKEAKAYSEKTATRIVLNVIGRTGSEVENWKANWQQVGIQVNIFGDQTEANISKAINEATIGISTTPYMLAEKSGTIAAMISHGIPVICITKPWVPKVKYQGKKLDGIFEYKEGGLEELFQVSTKPVFPENSRSRIAELFIAELIRK